jgi:polysaccharide export outer membrane protein
VVTVDAGVAAALESAEHNTTLAPVFGGTTPPTPTLGLGDRLEVSIWEAPPAVLFAPSTEIVAASASSSRVSGLKPAAAVHLPGQAIAVDGSISLPFVGRIKVAGLNEADAASSIRDRLQGLAHQPQVLVTVVDNVSSTVTVVGSVNQSQRLPLTARGERILDAVAAAGGPRERLDRTTLQLSRGDRNARIALEAIVRDPTQNVYLQPGDVVSLYYQPLSFTALGATGRNDEIAFEATGMTLAQALGRVNGVVDQRAAPKGVFVFRLEPGPAGVNQPVVYRVDLTDPMTFWAIQHFPMHDRDLLYVANAPSAEFEKFMSIVATAAYSLTNFGIKP